MKKGILAFLISISMISINGCVVAAVGAGIAAVKYANSKKADAQARNKDSYNQYVLGMQKINLERQKSGLKPLPILSAEQYEIGFKN